VVAADLADELLKPAGQFLAAIFLHPLPEVDVVEVLPRIVDDAGVLVAERLLADLLQGELLVGAAGDQPVAGVDIGLMMLVVMKLQRLDGHEWGECIVGIGEWGKLERHGGLRRCFAAGLPGIAARYRLGTGKTSQGRACCSDSQNGRGPGPLKSDTQGGVARSAKCVCRVLPTCASAVRVLAAQMRR